jgi:hypothetical protein
MTTIGAYNADKRKNHEEEDIQTGVKESTERN